MSCGFDMSLAKFGSIILPPSSGCKVFLEFGVCLIPAYDYSFDR
jgi:hypothetical protein